MFRISSKKINVLLPSIDSQRLDIDLYRQTGAFILRRALPQAVVQDWRKAWDSFYDSLRETGRQLNPRNAVVVHEPSPPDLAEMYKHPALLDIVEKIYGPDLAFCFQRFLLKDSDNLAPVFLHQDFSYNVGWPDKLSVFVPLNPMGPDNGGLILYPGTHQFGFLGDAGEIDPSIAPDMPAICASLEPGDVALMHPFTWHASGPYERGPARALVQICYQPADDPTSIELVRGKWQTDVFLRDCSSQRLFKRSRVSRLIEMQAELDRAAGTKK